MSVRAYFCIFVEEQSTASESEPCMLPMRSHDHLSLGERTRGCRLVTADRLIFVDDCVGLPWPLPLRLNTLCGVVIGNMPVPNLVYIAAVDAPECAY